MPVIKFSKNWNHKLNCNYFTTIRLLLEKNTSYYYLNLAEIFSVFLKGEKYCKAQLISISKIKLNSIVDNYLNFTDAGLTVIQFYKLMKKFYGKKKEWQGWDTPCLLLLFKRMNELE